MSERVQLAGADAQRVKLRLCTLDLVAPAPHVLASRVQGMGSVEMVERVIEFGDALMRNVPAIDIFHDFSGVTGYQSEARRILVDWGVRNENGIASVHVLFRSKVVAMGVSMATRLMRGRLTGYADRSRFGAARSAAIDG